MPHHVYIVTLIPPHRPDAKETNSGHAFPPLLIIHAEVCCPFSMLSQPNVLPEKKHQQTAVCFHVSQRECDMTADSCRTIVETKIRGIAWEISNKQIT